MLGAMESDCDCSPPPPDFLLGPPPPPPIMMTEHPEMASHKCQPPWNCGGGINSLVEDSSTYGEGGITSEGNSNTPVAAVVVSLATLAGILVVGAIIIYR